MRAICEQKIYEGEGQADQESALGKLQDIEESAYITFRQSCCAVPTKIGKDVRIGTIAHI